MLDGSARPLVEDVEDSAVDVCVEFAREVCRRILELGNVLDSERLRVTAPGGPVLEAKVVRADSQVICVAEDGVVVGLVRNDPVPIHAPEIATQALVLLVEPNEVLGSPSVNAEPLLAAVAPEVTRKR